MNTRDALELKGCPFCGSSGETLIRGFRYAHGSSDKENAIWCPTCDCKGPEKSWNTRATPATDKTVAEIIGRAILAATEAIEAAS